MPDIHLPSEDPMTMARVNVRARCAAPSSTMFNRFDARRYEWLAEVLREAGRPEAARLADAYAAEHRMAADVIDAQDALSEGEDA
jgi:hypothetical protein